MKAHLTQMNYRILILYAKSGFLGHKVIAENYANLLTKYGHHVLIQDVLQVEGGSQIELGNRIYFLILQKFSWLWRLLYKHWHQIPWADWIRTSVLPRRFKKTQQKILSERADLIISTHPIATSVVSYLKAKGLITTALITTFSDWHTQRFWIFPHVNKFLVATSQQKTDLIDMGYRKEQIEVTGMLLAEHFYFDLRRNDVRHSLGLPQDKKVILVMGGGKGWRIEELIVALGRLKTTEHIIIIGGSEERKTEIKKYIWKHIPQPTRFVVTGFVDTALYIAAADLLVSKLGGLTTSQAFLLRLPILPVSILPGQEDENLHFLQKNNAVLVTGKSEDLAINIDSLLSDESKLEEVQAAAYRLVTPQTPQYIPEIITSLLRTQ